MGCLFSTIGSILLVIFIPLIKFIAKRIAVKSAQKISSRVGRKIAEKAIEKTVEKTMEIGVTGAAIAAFTAAEIIEEKKIQEDTENIDIKEDDFL